ncbi:MAG: 50S ribosomal protein L9 [Lentisphaeraceae bacterium]|nr:50S ribosomal protein L9 [Lentisphaeraceae bacterium]
MAIELILMDNVDHLGNVGEKVKVADGYARNFLLPQGLAVHASKAIERQLEARKAVVAEKYQAEVAAANEVAAKVAETSITVPMQVGEEDEKLFGSVTSIDVTRLLAEEGLEIDRKQIDLTEPIKTLGVHEVPVKLHKEVTATLKVWVVKA